MIKFNYSECTTSFRLLPTIALLCSFHNCQVCYSSAYSRARAHSKYAPGSTFNCVFFQFTRAPVFPKRYTIDRQKPRENLASFSKNIVGPHSAHYSPVQTFFKSVHCHIRWRQKSRRYRSTSAVMNGSKYFPQKIVSSGNTATRGLSSSRQPKFI